MDLTYDNTARTGWHKGFPDALARIDLDTFRRAPWDGDVPFFLGEFVEVRAARETPLQWFVALPTTAGTGSELARVAGVSESGARQGANRSDVGHLARICDAAWRPFSACFQQPITDSGH